MKVAARRMIAGKWVCNNGQACIAVDYIVTTKSFAPKLVSLSLFNRSSKSLYVHKGLFVLINV